VLPAIAEEIATIRANEHRKPNDMHQPFARVTCGSVSVIFVKGSPTLFKVLLHKINAARLPRCPSPVVPPST
jgi:hypothetical protein